MTVTPINLQKRYKILQIHFIYPNSGLNRKKNFWYVKINKKILINFSKIWQKLNSFALC